MFDIVPGVPSRQAFQPIWNAMDCWVAIHVFHQSGPAVVPGGYGSGDTLLDYIQELCFVVLAALATLVWSAVDRKRKNYRRADAWLRVLVRYTLAVTMLTYGLIKVFPLQFAKPGLSRLFSTYGESSPMGLLWTFMGASTAYTIFSGCMESISALLLFFRRTVVLGALLATAVTANILMLNLCYDVPVKLYSFNLLAMALFLLIPHLRSAANLVVLHRVTQPPDLYELRIQRRPARITLTAAKMLFIAAVMGSGLLEGWSGYKQLVLNPKRPPLYGAWSVETFTRNGIAVPPLITETTRWKRVIAENPATLAIRMMDDRERFLPAQYDPAKSQVTISQGPKKDVFSYSRPDPDHIVLSDNSTGNTLVIRLKKMDTSKLLLLNRGFHWINPFPFNR